jgi:hypothetical protein
MPANNGQFCYYQLPSGLNITACKLSVTIGTISSRLAIGIYSFSEYTHSDGIKYYFPSTLRYTITSNLVADIGTITINNLDFTTDSSLTENNLWAFVFLPNQNISLNCWATTTAIVKRGDFGHLSNTVPGSVVMGQRINLGTSTLPSSFATPTTDTVVAVNNDPWFLLQYTIN